jgi:hypothetical protein
VPTYISPSEAGEGGEDRGVSFKTSLIVILSVSKSP